MSRAAAWAPMLRPRRAGALVTIRSRAGGRCINCWQLTWLIQKIYITVSFSGSAIATWRRPRPPAAGSWPPDRPVLPGPSRRGAGPGTVRDASRRPVHLVELPGIEPAKSDVSPGWPLAQLRFQDRRAHGRDRQDAARGKNGPPRRRGAALAVLSLAKGSLPLSRYWWRASSGSTCAITSLRASSTPSGGINVVPA